MGADKPTTLLLAHGMAHRFLVTTGSYDLGAWSKVSGLSVTWDLAEYRVGHSDQYFKYAGVAKFGRLKLSRAADASATPMVQQWLDEVNAAGGMPAAQGSVDLLTSMGEPVASWTLLDMFPISWQISEFDASTGKVAMETLEIVHSGFLTGRRSGIEG